MTATCENGWHRHGFGHIATAAFISAVGDRMSYVVLPFLLFDLGCPPAEVALVLGARAVGYAVLVLLGGVAADRIPSGRLMAASDAARAITQGATLALILAGAHWLAAVVALQAVFGLAEGVFRPAARRILPTVVAHQQLERANGVFAAATTAGLLIGPALAAAAAAVDLSAVALAVDAASFVASACILMRLVRHRASSPAPFGFATASPAEHPARPNRRASLVADLRGGWATVLSTPWLRLVILVSTVFHATALAAVYSLGPAFAESAEAAERGWHGATTWGALVTVFGLGGLCGGLVATRIRARRPVLVLLVALTVLAAQPLFLTAPLPLPAVGALQFVAGVALSIFSVMQESAEQRGLDQSTLGRAASVDLFATTVAMPLGYLVSAQAVRISGSPLALQLLGACAVLVCLAAFAVPASRAVVRPAVVRDPHPRSA